MKSKISRLVVSTALVGAGLAVQLALASAADLTVTAYGGLWQTQFEKCFVKPFKQKTGLSVDVVLGTPVQWMNQIAANPDHPPIQVLINTIDGAYEGIKRGLVAPMSAENVPNFAELAPEFQKAGKGYGAVLSYGALGLAYNKDTVTNPPKTWKEFVDGTIAGKWNAAIPSINYVATPMTVIWLYAHVFGGNIDNIEPGMQQIKAMKASGHLLFWSDPNQFLNLMQSGEVDLGMYWDGRTWAFHDGGHDNVAYLNPKPGAVISPTMIQVAKNAPKAAWDFVNTALDAQNQACWANVQQYGMSNKNVNYSAKVKPRISKLGEVLWPPFADAPARMSGWVERWNKEIGQ